MWSRTKTPPGVTTAIGLLAALGVTALLFGPAKWMPVEIESTCNGAFDQPQGKQENLPAACRPHACSGVGWLVRSAGK